MDIRKNKGGGVLAEIKRNNQISGSIFQKGLGTHECGQSLNLVIF
jgi:hypothetical protein